MMTLTWSNLDMTTRTWSNLDMMHSDMTGSVRTDLDMINSDLTDNKGQVDRNSWYLLTLHANIDGIQTTNYQYLNTAEISVLFLAIGEFVC